MKLFVSFVLLFCSGCASTSPAKSTSLGLAEGVKGIAQTVVEDMERFFSKQIVFSQSESCSVRVLLDGQKIENESAERFDFSALQQAFLEHLKASAAAGNLPLLGRRIALLDKNRRYLGGNKQKSCIKKGANNAGADYLFAGRLISRDMINDQDVRQRHTLISFWLLDLETGAKAWSSPPYQFRRYGQNDLIYR